MITKLTHSTGKTAADRIVGRISSVSLLLLTFLSVTSSGPVPTKATAQIGQQQQPSEENIKPSGLTLLVEIQLDLKVMLNGMAVGSVNDSAPLSKTLADVFRERQEMGVYKLGTNEVEKTVVVKAERTIKYGDYVKVIKAIEDAGPSLVGLVTDEKKVPLNPNARPEVKRRDLPAEEQETSQPASPPTPKVEAQVPTIREIVSSPAQGTTAIVKRVMLDQRIDPETIRKSAAVVEVKGAGEYYLGGRRVEKTALYQGLKDWFKGEAEDEMDTYIIAPKEMDYGIVEDAINEAWEANRRIILVTGSTASNSQAVRSAPTSTNWTPLILEFFGGIILIGAVWFILSRRKG